MAFERITWPSKRLQRERRPVDPILVADVISTAYSGETLKVPAWMYEGLNGATYPSGYALHQRNIGDGFIALRARVDMVVCDQCKTEINVVGCVVLSGVRLRRRDACPLPGCDGRVTATRKTNP